MRYLRALTISGALFVTAVLLVAIAAVVHRPAPATAKLRVTASFYPMAEFSRQVGGSYVQVATLVKPGVEPHDYDPSTQDIAGMYDSALFVYNGAGLERWAGRLQGDLAHRHITVIQASQGIPLKSSSGAQASNATADPHVWMDPVLAIQEVQNIRDGLIHADPAHASSYRANASNYMQQLRNLDAAYRSGLANCGLHTIITSHQALNYLGAQYGITAVGIAGLSPDNEPSPQKLAEVAQTAKRTGAQYIFFENLVSPKLAQTIAQETGARTIAFNPLEGLTQQQIQQGQNYISVQKDNLSSLRTALNCR